MSLVISKKILKDSADEMIRKETQALNRKETQETKTRPPAR